MAPDFGAPALRLPRASTDANSPTHLQCSFSDLGFSEVVGIDITDVSTLQHLSVHLSETSAARVDILLTYYGTARLLLAGDAEM